MAYLLDTALDPEAQLAQFRARLTDAGAIVSFTGLVRAQAASSAVKALHLQSHPALTAQGIAEAITRAQSRWPLLGVLIRHRIGEICARQPIVLVAAASQHRRDAFQAADFLMDYLKTEAIFWKQEITDTGASWIEPKDNDYADNARWHSDRKTTQ